MLLREAELMLRQRLPEESAGSGEEMTQPQGEYSLALGKVLAHYGYFCMRGSQPGRAQILLEEALELLSTGREQLALADTLMWLGFNTGRYQGNYTRSEELIYQSLTLSREINHAWNEAMALARLGSLAHGLNKSQAAYRLFQEGLAILRRLGDPSGIAYCLSSSGIVATALGRYAEAQDFLRESLLISLEIGNRWETGFSLAGLGLNAQAQEEHLKAQQLFQESINAFREIGDQWNIARALNLLGRADYSLGDCTRARQSLQEALRLALSIQATTLILQTALSWAILLANAQETRLLGAELFLALLRHPAAGQNIQNPVKTHLAELETHLSPQQLEAIQVRPLNLVIEELLYRAS
jgi:tetratricopeptide (TPR) repeat protein